MLLHNTGRRSLYFKNGIYITNGTNEEDIPAACELVAHGDFGPAALAVSRFPDYRGTTWTRNLIALKDQFMLVIDQVRIDRQGQYMVGCNWRTPAYATLDNTGWVSQQDDVTFRLLPGQMKGLTSDRAFQRDGATRPTVLRQNRTIAGKPNDQVVFENLLYTSSPSRNVNCAIRRVAPGAIVVRKTGADGKPDLYFAAASDRAIDTAGTKTNAAAVLVGQDQISLAGDNAISLAGLQLTADAGQITLDSNQSQKVAAWLADLWDHAEPPTQKTNKTLAAAKSEIKPLWQQDGPLATDGLIDGVQFKPVRNIVGQSALATDWIMPLLIAEPRLKGQQGNGLQPPQAGKGSRGKGEMDANSEPVLAPLKDAEFVLEMPYPVLVNEIVLYGDSFGETSKPIPPAHLDLELTFTKDNFAADKRVHQVRVRRQASYYNLYKGHCYLFARYRAIGFEQAATAVRVRVVDASFNEMILTDLRVRSAGPVDRQPVRARAVDLEGDQSDEILTWTTNGDVAVVGSVRCV